MKALGSNAPNVGRSFVLQASVYLLYLRRFSGILYWPSDGWCGRSGDCHALIIEFILVLIHRVRRRQYIQVSFGAAFFSFGMSKAGECRCNKEESPELQLSGEKGIFLSLSLYSDLGSESYVLHASLLQLLYYVTRTRTSHPYVDTRLRVRRTLFIVGTSDLGPNMTSSLPHER